MSAESPVATRRWSVGPYTATMSIPRPFEGSLLHAVVEWEPRQPARLTARQMDEYRTGRNAAVRSLAAELGLTAAILEI